MSSSLSSISGPRRYNGKVKQIDTDKLGFTISYDRNRVVLAEPSSFSDPNSIQVGDRVEFSLTATDVILTGPRCYCCGRQGHYASVCPRKTNPRVRCYQCGILGHYARDCHSGSRSDDDDDDDKKEIIRASVTNWKDVFRGDDDDECRSIVCVKKMENMRKVEEDEDCFILDFDPTQPIKFSNLCLSDKSQPDQDVTIIAEKGQVACRDYPHSRHLCATHSFKSTSHELHCKLCYCYICDIPAPCKEWTKIIFQHCDATPDLPLYREFRDVKKRSKMA